MSDPQSTATAPAIINVETFERNMQREFVLDFIEKSNNLKKQFAPVWDEVLENYLVVPFGLQHGQRVWPPYHPEAPARYRIHEEFRPRLKDPETHQIVESLTSQAMGLLLGQPDYITAQPIGLDDPEKSRMISRLLMALLDMPGVYRTHYQLFKDAFIFGTAVLEMGWTTRTREQVVQVPRLQSDGQPMLDEQGAIIWDLAITEVVWRDAPLQREVSLWDFYPDPGGTRIQEDMTGVAKRFKISKSDAIQYGSGQVYDLARVREVIRRFENAERVKAEKTGSPEGPFPHMADEVPSKVGSIGGFEYYGELPWRPRGRDKSTNRVITLWGDEIVRSHIIPFMDGMKPFKEIVVNPVSGRFYGLSPAEVVRFLQDTADNLLMVLTDATNLAVRSPLLMGSGFGGDPRRLRARRLNDVIPCSNPDMVKPLESDLNVLQFASKTIIERKLMMREASGSANPLEGPTEKSATEASEVVRLASQKVETMVGLIEREDYPQIGRMLHSRLRQFALDDGYIATLKGDKFDVTLDQINVDADIRFVGSRQTQSKFQRSIQYREALKLLTPEVLMTVPEVAVAYLREVLDFPDAEQIVKLALERIMLQLGIKQAAAGGAQPGNQSGGGGPQSAGKARPDEQPVGSQAQEAELGGKRLA